MVDMAATGIARRIFAYHMDHRLFPGGEPGQRKVRLRRVAIGEPERCLQELRRLFHVLGQDREVMKQVDGHDVWPPSFIVEHLYRAHPMSSNRAEARRLKSKFR